MDFMDWIPTSILAVVLWLSRKLIATCLTNAVRHEYDEKIERLKTELRKSEESFKADLQTKETQIEVLRSGAISGLASRQAALDKRRIEAVDQIWSAVTELAPAKAMSGWISAFNFKAVSKLASTNEQLRNVFKTLEGDFDIKENSTLVKKYADKARPFVTDFAWAIFSAYKAIVYHAVIKSAMLKTGLDAPDILTTDGIKKLIKVTLPHQTEYVEKHGDVGYHYLLDELESTLLVELHKILQGGESDKDSVKQSAAIMKEVSKVMESASKTTTT